jgi:hypothetical protein
MAGRGPAPKDPSQRARRNKPSGPDFRVIVADPVDQPDLPTVMVEEDGELVEFVWPAVTQHWWAMWRESPLSSEFTASDWSFLLDTALLHAKFWSGSSSAGAELRLRVAKFGATPEDRARLRIQFAQADEADAKRPEKRAGGSRREGLRLAE